MSSTADHRDLAVELATFDKTAELVELLERLSADWGMDWPPEVCDLLTSLSVLGPEARKALRGGLTRSSYDWYRLRGAAADRAHNLQVVHEILPWLWDGERGVERVRGELARLETGWANHQGHRLQALLTVHRHAGGSLSPKLLAMLRRSAHESHWNNLSKYVDTLEGNVLNPGEPWADRVLELLATAEPGWKEFVGHLGAASSAKPSAKWTKQTRAHLDTLGVEVVRDRALSWLALVGQPRSLPIDESGMSYAIYREGQFDPYNAVRLRGLVWAVALLPPDRAVTRELARLVDVTQRKIPGVGPRSQLITNAAILALSMIDDPDAVGQIARLAGTVKAKPTLKSLNAALDRRAEALGISRDEVEELAVPAYELTEVGLGTGGLADAVWEIRVEADGVKLLWRNASGKAVKSPPASVKRDHAAEVKELKARVKEIAKMATAQSERLDRQFLAQREWRFDAWRERYLDHPLVGTVARRLIWNVDGVAAVHADTGLSALDGTPVEAASDAVVTLWHPIGRDTAEVLAWRDLLERHEIVQPFKQAHREVYLLTEAEENTRVYSNRFAAHILRQHQYNALAKTRGWDNQLRLMVDDSYEPTTKRLPQWGLRAEFWVEGIGDDYGNDTTEAGTYLRLVSDQVRFYREGSPRNYAHAGGGGYEQYAYDPDDVRQPVPLSEVPALVLSEVLRDVDLFVGVASVGNDPEWSDGGPDGRHRDYWHSYSFGDLSATALTRKALLERLVPRLAVADRAEIDGKYLRVRGDIRTYKIHLGSGNILMEPDSEYLCIVAKQVGTGVDGKVFLPFDGDRTLSVILSKALLLAKDTAITDRTITSQINRNR